MSAVDLYFGLSPAFFSSGLASRGGAPLGGLSLICSHSLGRGLVFILLLLVLHLIMMGVAHLFTFCSDLPVGS